MEVIRLVVKNTIEMLEFQREFENDLKENKIVRTGFDTETTGLHIMKDTPFLLVFGYQTKLDTIKVMVSLLPMSTTKFHVKSMLDIATKHGLYNYAWNTKFDMHMLANVGVAVTEIRWADGMGVARLTLNVDDPYSKRLALKSIAKRYVDSNADEYEKDVKKALTALRKTNKAQLNALLMPYNITADEAINKYNMREPLNCEVLEIVRDFEDVNYSHVDPNIMLPYACNDVIIMLKYLDKAIPYVYAREQQDVLNEEFQLIVPLWEQERAGFKIDLDYLEESRIKVYNYMKTIQDRFVNLAGRPIKSGQHAEIKKLFKEWGYDVPSVSKDVLPTIMDKLDGRAREFVEVLLKLRTIEKWYSTYILRFINGQYKGKYHSTFNQFGTVSGRLSSDCQQFPKKALYDDEGQELFHPRRLVQPSGNGYDTMYLLDFSQMELRVQAHYTILTSGGDVNLCRAYMPFQLEDVSQWTPTDLHTATAKNAFGEDCEHREDFKTLRNASKTTNFACLYGASTPKLCKIPLLSKFSYQEVDKMRTAFYNTFPNILAYRNAIRTALVKAGYVKNGFGRRYYAGSPNSAHEISNYVIQGKHDCPYTLNPIA